MHQICMLGFLSAFLVFGVGGYDYIYTCSERFPNGVIGVDGSNRVKRPSKVSTGYSNDLINGYHHVSKANGYDNKEIVYLEETRESKGTKPRVPCVNINTNQKVCLCSLDGTITDCSRRNLTFIPIVPPETTTLNMQGNSLTFLDQGSLTNISTLSKSLKSLDVSLNQISYIENGSLSNFTVLKTLDVSVNQISNTAIENLTSGISTQLEQLMLEKLELKEFPYGILPHLDNTSLTTFSVQDNYIKDVSTVEVFQSLKKLKHLDLSINFISHIIISHSENLETLILTMNLLREIPDCCSNGSKLPNLSKLILDYNKIEDLQTDRLDCLDNLQLLSISGSKIDRIPSNAFSRFKSLRRINLEGMPKFSMIEPYAFNSSSLLTLNIAVSHFVPDGTTFQFCPNLRELDISSNELFMSLMNHADWKNLLGYVPNLEYLDISYNKIEYLPKAIPQYLHNLKILYIDHNYIEFIPKGYFSPLAKLRVLTLNVNKISTITEQDFPPSFTNHLSCFHVFDNPFVCNCDLLWFIEFLKNNKNNMAHSNYYHCHNTKYRERLTSSTLNKQVCMFRSETFKIIQYTCIVIVSLLIIVSIVHRYRLRLRCMLYVLKINRRKRSENREVAFTHDVYVSSADADFDTVYYQIITELENKGLNVYFPHRDGMPGTLALGDCLDKIDDSKYVILCLSNSYLRDNLCEYEAHMALEKSIMEHCNSNAIIVVVLEDICTINVTKILQKLTRTGEFLIWDDNPDSVNLFRRQLHERLQLPVYND